MIFYIVVFIIGAAIGGYLTELYAGAFERFTHAEVLLITQEIEKIKATSETKYKAIVSEWKGLISNSKAKVELASEGLKQIISKVKAI
jgi:hypothetical protein